MNKAQLQYKELYETLKSNLSTIKLLVGSSHSLAQTVGSIESPRKFSGKHLELLEQELAETNKSVAKLIKESEDIYTQVGELGEEIFKQE